MSALYTKSPRTQTVTSGSRRASKLQENHKKTMFALHTEPTNIQVAQDSHLGKLTTPEKRLSLVVSDGGLKTVWSHSAILYGAEVMLARPS